MIISEKKSPLIHHYNNFPHPTRQITQDPNVTKRAIHKGYLHSYQQSAKIKKDHLHDKHLAYKPQIKRNYKKYNKKIPQSSEKL
jgi:hypothetical protein